MNTIKMIAEAISETSFNETLSLLSEKIEIQPSAKYHNGGRSYFVYHNDYSILLECHHEETVEVFDEETFSEETFVKVIITGYHCDYPMIEYLYAHFARDCYMHPNAKRAFISMFEKAEM